MDKGSSATNKVVKISAILLMGLISGCSDTNTRAVQPSGVLGYVNIDTFANDDRAPAVAFDGMNFLVVYEETLPLPRTDHDIIGARISPAGTVLGYVNIATSTSDDRAPKVAFDGTNYLVVYEEAVSSTNHDIIGARVDPNPNALTPVLGYVNIDVSANDDTAPAMTFGGGNYLVVYQEANGTDHNIIGAFVDTTGTVSAGSPFNIDVSTNDDTVPSVAFGGGDFLVAYERDATVTTTDHNTIGAFVDTTGAVLTGSPFNIDVSANDDVAPAVASDGTNFLVAYQRIFSTDSDIQGALVSATGLTVGLFGIDTAIDFDDVLPQLAFDGTNYLVVYQETFSNTDHDIIGTRVSPAGVANPNVVLIDTHANDDYVPAVAFGGMNYLVVYEEALPSPRTDHDIIGALVTP